MGVFLVVIADLIGLFFSYQLSYILRVYYFPRFLQFPEPLPLMIFNPYWLPVIFLIFFWYEGLYTRKLPLWEEVKQVWKGLFITSIAIFAIVSLGRLYSDISRTVLVLMFLNALWIVPLVRLNSKKIIFSLGLLRSQVLIIGAGMTGRLLLKSFNKEKNLAYNVIGFLDDDPAKKGARIEGVKVLGGLGELDKYLTKDIEIILAIPGLKPARTVELVNILQKKAKKVSFIPDLFGIPFFESDMNFFFDSRMLVLNVRNNLKNTYNKFIKSIFDAFLALPVFVVSLPLIFIIALAIKLESRGPVFFIQDRIGKDDKNFKCIKFRSMYLDSEAILKKTLAKDAEGRAEWKKYCKLKSDPRVTRVGKILRRFSLDELPQIFNVLKGDMSIIGPRPYLNRETKSIGKYYSVITEVQPGITGLWQVSGRNKTSFEERLVLDAWYIQNWSLWLDITILIKTIGVVLKREGAY